MTYLPRATLMMGAPGILLIGRGENENSSKGSGNLPDASLEIAIVRGHDVHAVFDDSVHQAIVGVGAFMVAFDSLESRVFGNS